MTAEKTISVIIVGDEGIGKSSLAQTLTQGSFPTADTLRASHDKAAVLMTQTDTALQADDTTYHLHICDPHTENVDKDLLQKADVCFLCFDLSGPASFKRVKVKWLPVLKRGRFAGRIVLVGLKEDLSKDKGTQALLSSEGLEPISGEAACNLANEINACSFVEVSALKYLGIQELKEKTVFSTLRSSSTDRKDRKRCVVM